MEGNYENVRPQFGQRFLKNDSNVFQHNAWDDVDWDESMEKEALEKVEKNSKSRFNEVESNTFENDANLHWDKFYGIHQNRFFKDRNWLFTEFPELNMNNYAEQVLHSNELLSGESYPGCTKPVRFFEVGCGVGNTIFPILQNDTTNNLFMYGCDLSQTAIELVKSHSMYNSERCHAFVCNISDTDSSLPIPEASLDVILLIFVLSAITPDKMQTTINKLATLLKPGGIILFRDYGRYDLAQLRFKDGRCISDNFYARGDGTCVYFFAQNDLKDMFTSAGLVEKQNVVDRRLQVNRGKQLKMYRVWIQCKYMKPHT